MFLRSVTATIVSSVIVAGTLGGPAASQDRVRWKMQSAFGSQLPHLGPPGQRFSKDVEVMSGGRFEINALPGEDYKYSLNSNNGHIHDGLDRIAGAAIRPATASRKKKS